MPVKFTRIAVDEPEKGIIHIRLNAPPDNIIDIKMMQELPQAVTLKTTSGEETRVVIISGEGRNFSAGLSVQDLLDETTKDMIKTYSQFFHRLINLGIPTVAMVRGQCLGAGLELAAICNFMFADSSAEFGLPEIKRGVFPRYAPLMLPWRIGQGFDDELILSGRSFSPEEAFQNGLINQVCEPVELEGEVMAFVRDSILPHPPAIMRKAVKSSRWVFNNLFRENFEGVEKFFADELMLSHDANIGLKAFLDKKPPEWKNM
ncbi:enoyl-CoA hydratase/isomerase family protein [Planctomycetota bacterium]